MQILEKPKQQELENDLETKEKVKPSTVDKIKILRQKTIQALKLTGIGIAGLYLGANALKPQIAESILSNTYEYATSDIISQFPENTEINTTKESKNHQLKTFLTREGNIVRYVEKTASDEKTQVNGANKVLIEFPGIDNDLPHTNSYRAFEKVVTIYYDSKKMNPQEIKQLGLDVSEMINTNFKNYQKSTISTSFGGLVQSHVLPNVNFIQSKTYAPFNGETNLVNAVTGLPIPVSIFHPDKFNNVIQNPNPNLEVYIPENDRITGGLTDLKRSYPNAKIQKSAGHEDLGKGKEYHENQKNMFFPVEDKYTKFKEKQDKRKSQLKEISINYNSKSFKIFSQILNKLDNVDPSIITTIRKEFKQPANNDELFPIEMNRFIVNHPLSGTIVGNEFLKQHEVNYQEYTKLKQKIEMN
jgi:hypothetical protein